MLRQAKDGIKGCGCPLTKIRVWQPNTAYSKEKEAKIASSIKQLMPGEVPPEKKADEADDWIILELPVEYQSSTDAVRQWIDAYPIGQTYTIVGYPYGLKGFIETEVVKPTSISKQFECRQEANGILQLVGTQTRPGISGGGVFESDSHAFAGIHRYRFDPTLQIRAVSAKKICERLHELGYEPTSFLGESTSKFRVNIPTIKNNAIDKICLSIIRYFEISESLSHNRTGFFEKIDQLFHQRNLEKVANVIDINEFRKIKAINMVKAISEELPKKFGDFKENTNLFATCSPKDPLLDRSESILQEIETIISCIRKLFQKFSPRDELYEKLDNLNRYKNLSNFIGNLRKVTESVNNKGGEQGLNSQELESNLNRLSYSINEYSNLLKEAVEK
ncbi:MAG: hypothetical protein HC877_01895 [Thioploca sp.]|nr:hypothetical protein [Thioploca sp.]